MNILSLNIQQGGGSRAGALLEWTLTRDPDVVVFPEWRNNAIGETIRNVFRERGYCLATATREEPGSYGILVASREAFETRRITPEASRNGEILVAELPFGLRMLAAYFPPNQWQKPFFHLCREEAFAPVRLPCSSSAT